MKSIYFLLLLVSFFFASCSVEVETDSNTERKTTEVSEDFLTTQQVQFLNSVSSINQKYEQCTRGAGAKFARWGLLAIADGIGGCLGSGVASWITSAAASTAYDAYLNHCQRKMAKSLSFGSVQARRCVSTDDSLYQSVLQSVTFSFCDSLPQNATDSIGFVHNKLIEQTASNTNTEKYYINDSIDYDNIMSVCQIAASDLCYLNTEVLEINKSDFPKVCNNVINIFEKLQNNKITSDSAFMNIKDCLANVKEISNSALFISLLARYISSCFSGEFQLNDVQSYADSLNLALKSANLSEKDNILCRKILQTAICSFLYWKYYHE